MLDGFGTYTAPGPTVKPAGDCTGRAVPDHPPGFYGPAEGCSGEHLADADRLKPLDFSALAGLVEPYRRASPWICAPTC